MSPLRIALLLTAAAIPGAASGQGMDHSSMPMPAGGSMPMPAGGAQAGKGTSQARDSAQVPRPGREQTKRTAARSKKAQAPGEMTASEPPMQGMSADPHAAHGMAATNGMDGMQGMTGASASQAEPPNPAPPAAALAGPAHAADLVFGQGDMAEARHELRVENGDLRAYRVLLDRFETQFQKGRDGYRWDVQAWYGGDVDKLWIKTEGNGSYRGQLATGEVQALWSRAVTPWFDLQAGVRQDFGPNPRRTHAVLGVQGLAPYSYNTEAALFLSNKGELTARLNADYDLLLTQRLILQPRAEVDLSAQNIPELGIGSGLSTVEVGLRLRYEFVPEFAPYVGIEYERSVGNTATYARANGESAATFRYLVGLRSWF